MPYGQAYPGLNASDVAAFVAARREAEERARQSQIDAIRWQGTQEYQTLIQSGVPAGDALRRAAPRMFFNDPAAISRALTWDTGQPGQIIERDGRLFTIDTKGNPRPVPQQWLGSTRVMGPGNQMYNIPLTRDELQAVPRTSVAPTPPDVVPLAPGQGSMIVQPSGAGTRIPASPTELIKVPDPDDPEVMITVTKPEYLLMQAKKKAKPLLDSYRASKAEDAASNIRPGWPDWAFAPFSETYKQKMERIKEQLKAYDLDEEGNPIPNSSLDKAIKAATPAAPTPQPPPAPAQFQAAPPTAPTQPAVPAVRRRVPPGTREGNYVPPSRRGTVTLGNTNAPLSTTLRGNPLTPPNVPLAPNEVLKVRRLPNGAYEWAVFDKTTNQRLRSAQ